MANVEQRAEAEAQHKGLSGGAARAYVGGVFNKIRQAHAKATTPGHGARHLKRAARKEARQEAKNRNERRKQLAAQERARLRTRTHSEEPRAKSAAPATPVAPKQPTSKSAPKLGRMAAGRAEAKRILTTDLKPINYVEGREINPAAPLDPYFLQHVYGDKQLRTALNLYPQNKLREGVEAVKEKHPGTRPKGSSKAAMLDYIESHVKGGAQPAEKPAAMARPATTPVKAPAKPEGKAVSTKPQEHPELKPIKDMTGRHPDPSAPVSATFLRELYGDAQLHDALDRYTHGRLRESATAAGVSASGSREQIIQRLMAKAQGKPQPKPAAMARPATPAPQPAKAKPEGKAMSTKAARDARNQHARDLAALVDQHRASAPVSEGFFNRLIYMDEGRVARGSASRAEYEKFVGHAVSDAQYAEYKATAKRNR